MTPVVPWGWKAVPSHSSQCATVAPAVISLRSSPSLLHPSRTSVLCFQMADEPGPSDALQQQIWYHGKVTRIEAEANVKLEGEFLVSWERDKKTERHIYVY